MYIRLSTAVVCAALVLVSFPAFSSVLDIVNEVSVQSYTDFMQNSLYTHTGDDRGFGAEHDLARTNIVDAFTSYGLSTSLEGFAYSSQTYYNVVGVLPGTTRPNDIYIIGAHFDSVSNPGADDNASGTAGVLEAARVLTQYNFEATLVFIAFDREEQGLVGSNAYATSHSGDNILGMISLDMIAYNLNGQNQAGHIRLRGVRSVEERACGRFRDVRQRDNHDDQWGFRRERSRTFRVAGIRGVPVDRGVGKSVLPQRQ